MNDKEKDKILQEEAYILGREIVEFIESKDKHNFVVMAALLNLLITFIIGTTKKERMIELTKEFCELLLKRIESYVD